HSVLAYFAYFAVPTSFSGLKSSARPPLHPDIVSITRLVPDGIDVGAEYRQHLLDKHRWRPFAASWHGVKVWNPFSKDS
ncbi:MAG: hypothetical protein AAB676_05080, partial [Verrucomicrobiota bacterium]